MKITKNKFYKIYEETVSYTIFYRKDAILPIKHKLKFEFSSTVDDFVINLQGLTFSLWLDAILKHKLVVASENHQEVEPLKEYFGEPLFVEDIGFNYIYKTIFQILENLLPETVTLESIEYE